MLFEEAVEKIILLLMQNKSMTLQRLEKVRNSQIF